MGFEKLNFEKTTTDGVTEFKINNKFVTEEIYNSTMSDESLYVLPPLPKMNDSPENSCNNNEDNVEQCACEECSELLTIISDIREMSDSEALDGLRNYIEAIKVKTSLETSSSIYNEIGNSMIKVSARLEDQLEGYLEQFIAEEYEE